MCGITGYKVFSKSSPDLSSHLGRAVQSLSLRGPDVQDQIEVGSVGLGHTRLSIIDTSSNANQPMLDPTGRYALIFNGEIYNYEELRSNLKAIEWKSTSDTEVLLHLLIKKGKSCLQELNGFFSLAFYDKQADYLLIARDRMGIKPCHYYVNEDFVAFGSEMKALLSYPIPKQLNHEALYWYLRLTYIPNDLSMIHGVKKVLPGQYLEVVQNNLSTGSYFQLHSPQGSNLSYTDAKTETIKLLEKSVQRRMVADVPLGAFLSGGTDSSAVVSIASQFNSNLNTFSIGYKDHDFFDETNYAELVANKFKTNHTTYSLTNTDLLESVTDVIDYIDEPFADSSAIPTYILSQKVAQSMKVALSGDGADELFGGYYKHLAFSKASQQSFANTMLRQIAGSLSLFPTSRSSKLGNLTRRIAKYAQLLKLDSNEQYWHLASFNLEAESLLNQPFTTPEQLQEGIIPQALNGLNDFLDADLKMVLSGDMLTKVDLMSMANSLEVRVPFLDKHLVAFARSLPTSYKVKKNHRKKVLQDAFEHILPKELHHRSKKGFEVPMLDWLRNELNEDVSATVFNDDFIQTQGIFNATTIKNLERQLNSNNPGDIHAVIWTLYVFQKWHQKYFL